MRFHDDMVTSLAEHIANDVVAGGSALDQRYWQGIAISKQGFTVFMPSGQVLENVPMTLEQVDQAVDYAINLIAQGFRYPEGSA